MVEPVGTIGAVSGSFGAMRSITRVGLRLLVTVVHAVHGRALMPARVMSGTWREASPRKHQIREQHHIGVGHRALVNEARTRFALWHEGASARDHLGCPGTRRGEHSVALGPCFIEQNVSLIPQLRPKVPRLVEQNVSLITQLLGLGAYLVPQNVGLGAHRLLQLVALGVQCFEAHRFPKLFLQHVALGVQGIEAHRVLQHLNVHQP